MKKNIKNTCKKFLPVMLGLTLFAESSVFMTGCASEQASVADENITLIEPVAVSESAFTVENRNIYLSSIVPAVCNMAVEEYSFSGGVSFDSYGLTPGKEVKAGDALILGNTENVEDQIKKSREYLKTMAENHSETVTDLEKDIKDAQKSEKEYQDIVERLEDTKPENPEEAAPNGVLPEGMTEEQFKALSAAYEAWNADYERYDGKYRYALIQRQKLELRLKETNELYDLDYKYNQANLNNLLKNKDDHILASDKDGVVVGALLMSSGDWIPSKVPVVAVGDTSRKEIKSEFINQGVIRQAEDVYAMVDGKRYEVEYQPIDSQEYDQLYEKNGVVYSTFLIDDPNNEVPLGAYVVIVIISDARENVPCVPKNSVFKDEGGEFVYVLEDDGYENRYIKTGISDGSFIEIVSGLEVGERVKSDFGFSAGKNTTTVTKGTVSAKFEATGYLFYPSSKWIQNPVSHGVVYLDEVCVSRYQYVEKGEVLARIHVVGDTIEIARLERKISREKERLQVLIDEDNQLIAESKDPVNVKTIKARQESINDLQDQVNEMKADMRVTEIVATSSGVVTKLLNSKPGDLLAYNAGIAQIADESQCFIEVEDKDCRLAFGNSVNVNYVNSEGESKSVEGTVVSSNLMSLSKAICSDGYMLVSIPADAVSAMAASNRNRQYNGYYSYDSYKVTGTIRKVENVLTVPRKAVKDIAGTTYVVIQDTDGKYKLVSFVAGGSDSTNYWVAEGLTEGMTICLE